MFLVAFAGKSGGISRRAMMLPSEKGVDAAVQRVSDRGQLLRLGKTARIFPCFHGGAGDADAPSELGLAETQRLAPLRDAFRVLTSLTIQRFS